MKNTNIFIKVGSCYYNDTIPVISDNKYFFTLELYKDGIYIDCLEVADKFGTSKDNDSHTASFKPVYENGSLVGYKMV